MGQDGLGSIVLVGAPIPIQFLQVNTCPGPVPIGRELPYPFMGIFTSTCRVQVYFAIPTGVGSHVVLL